MLLANNALRGALKEKVEDVVNIGDKVKVKVLEIDKMGRINLALREIIK